MKLVLSKAQYRAVFDLRGLPEGAHYMVMASTHTPDGGGILEGTEEAFDELLRHISEDLGAGMVRPRAARALVEVCVMIQPDCLDWLGL